MSRSERIERAGSKLDEWVHPSIQRAVITAVMLSLTASGSWTAALWFRSMTERLRAIEIAVAEMPAVYLTHAQMARATEYFAYKNPALVVPDFESVKRGGRIVPINDKP